MLHNKKRSKFIYIVNDVNNRVGELTCVRVLVLCLNEKGFYHYLLLGAKQE